MKSSMSRVASVLILLFVIVTARRRTTTTTTTTTTSTTTTTTTNTNTTASSSDDVYVAAAKALIDSGSCQSIASDEDLCGEDATSYYSEFEYNGNRVIVASGVPNHEAEHDAEKPNPNIRCERWQYWVLPQSPTYTGSESDTSMGAMGIATSGAVFFDHRSSPDGSTAWYNEGTSLDSCSGHSAAGGEYHYHMVPACIENAIDASACEKVGYYRDGFPVYGYCNEADGNQLKSCWVLTGDLGDNDSDYTYDEAALEAGTCHLDRCGGYTFADGTYGYVSSEDYSFVPRCYQGDELVQPCGLTGF